MPAVTVYTKPNCPSCHDTMELMDELGVAYNPVDISIDIAARKELKGMGYREAPVVITSEGKWSGYNEKAIRDLASGDSAWDF